MTDGYPVNANVGSVALRRLRESAGLLPEHSEVLQPVAVKYDILRTFKARDDVLVAYSWFINRASPDVSRKPCPSLWVPPIFQVTAGNMPRQLRPLGGFDVLDPPEGILCFQEDASWEFELTAIMRCCYDSSYKFIRAWPSRVLFSDVHFPWTSVEQSDLEELLYKADLIESITDTTTTTTTTTTAISFNGIASAVSVFAGKLDITWEIFTDFALANVSNSSDVKYLLLSSEEKEKLDDGEGGELLRNRTGVLVQLLEGANQSSRSAQIRFAPGSTQFLIVLAVLHDAVEESVDPEWIFSNISFISSNRQATKIKISERDPVLKAGVNWVQVTAAPDVLETLQLKTLLRLFCIHFQRL